MMAADHAPNLERLKSHTTSAVCTPLDRSILVAPAAGDVEVTIVFSPRAMPFETSAAAANTVRLIPEFVTVRHSQHIRYHD